MCTGGRSPPVRVSDMHKLVSRYSSLVSEGSSSCLGIRFSTTWVGYCTVKQNIPLSFPWTGNSWSDLIGTLKNMGAPSSLPPRLPLKAGDKPDASPWATSRRDRKISSGRAAGVRGRSETPCRSTYRHKWGSATENVTPALAKKAPILLLSHQPRIDNRLFFPIFRAKLRHTTCCFACAG